MIFGFGKKRGRVRDDDDDDDDDEEDEDYVLFQGARNGNNPDLSENAKLVRAGLVPAKKLVSEALARRADTVRVEVKGKVAAVTFYVDGVAYPPTRMPAPVAQAITQMLKLLAGLDISVRNKHQAGGIKSLFLDKKYEIRVDVTPADSGAERLLIRTRDLAVRLNTPDDLGFSERLKEKIREKSSRRGGLLLAAGSAHSGLTTTAVGLVRGIDAYLYGIYCITDLEGRDLSHITIKEVEEGEDVDAAIMRIRRAEADVVYVPPTTEETARVYAEHAEHITLISELQSRDCADAIVKLRDLIGDPETVAKVLRLVVSQRLLRLLCQKCRQAYRPNPKLLGKVGLPPETKVLYRAPVLDDEDEEDLCSQCGGTGYFGRTGIVEYIEMSEGIAELVKSGADAAAIRAQARKEKMQTFQVDAVRLVAEGKTGLEELQRAFSAS